MFVLFLACVLACVCEVQDQVPIADSHCKVHRQHPNLFFGMQLFSTQRTRDIALI